MLTTFARHEQETAVLNAATRLFVALLRGTDDERGLLARFLPDVFPWSGFLPESDRAEFAAELVATLRAVDDLDNLAPVAQLITEWQHTAEVHADPSLVALLGKDIDDLGTASAPIQ